jgi:endoglucanase
MNSMGSCRIAVMAALLLVAGCPPTTDPRPPLSSAALPHASGSPQRGPHHPLGTNPFVGATWWSNPDSTARARAIELKNTQPAEAALLEKIAEHGGGADWIGEWIPDIQAWIAARIARHESTGRGALPVLVPYRIPRRDCGLYSAGGSPTGQAYREWINAAARGIGSHKAIVILEPDALASLEAAGCLSARGKLERLELLKFAVHTFESNPNTWVYIDAGTSNWIPVAEMARRLRAVGIEEADGFSLNVSNFQANDALLAYGKHLSALVGRKPFVIDTSRNGNGPPNVLDFESEAAWCNPEGRALGSPPTWTTGEPLCHAFLWIKNPGESDGECNGGPKAGAWFQEQALDLARRARW